MQIGRPEDMSTRPITEFGSQGASVTHVARGDDATVGRIELRAGGRLAMHPASCSQLFIVVEGEGTVHTDGGEPRRVSAGTSVWWQQGELHETRSETGLVAVVVEAHSLNPAFATTDTDASAG